jgi:EmrB/QacA subfamily drug resistance transporter
MSGVRLDGPCRLAAVRRALPWLVGVSFFMESLDVSILNTSAPTVAAALGVAPLQLKAALTCYALSQALFIPLSAWLSDRFGTRTVFAAALGVFSAASLLCGLSTGLPMLVVARSLQGMGGAMMMPVGRTVIVRTFPKADLVRAMSFVVIPGMIGPLLGPVTGSLIAEYVHWRAIFLVNLPVGLAGLWAALRLMPDYRRPERTPLDLAGFALFGAGVAALSHAFGLVSGRAGDRGDALPWLAAGGALLACYAARAARRTSPLLRLDVLKTRTFRLAVTGGFLSRLGIGGMPFLLPLYYQVGLGRTPLQSALLMLPQPLAAVSTKLLQPRFITRLGYRRILRANTLAIGLGIATFSAIGAATPAWWNALLAFAYGTATSLQFTCVNSLQFADLEPADTSTGSTLASVVQQLSQSFGVAVASGLTALLLGDAAATDRVALGGALRSAFLALGLLTALSSAVFGLLQPGDGAALSHHRQEPRAA